MRISDVSSDVCSSDLERSPPSGFLSETLPYAASPERKTGLSGRTSLSAAPRLRVKNLLSDLCASARILFKTGIDWQLRAETRIPLLPLPFPPLFPTSAAMNAPNPPMRAAIVPVTAFQQNCKIGRASCRESVCQYV